MVATIDFKCFATSTGRSCAPLAAKEQGTGSSYNPGAQRLMARGTSLYLNTWAIACKCCATGTAPMFVPSAAKAQATDNSSLPPASRLTARETLLYLTVATVVCKCIN